MPSQSQSQETYPLPQATLRDWFLRQKYPDSLCVQLIGYNVNVDRAAADQDQWVTSIIDRRFTSTLLRTISGSVYKLEGFIDQEMMTKEGYGEGLINLFREGFPGTWEAFLEYDLIEREKKRVDIILRKQQENQRRILQDIPAAKRKRESVKPPPKTSSVKKPVAKPKRTAKNTAAKRKRESVKPLPKASLVKKPANVSKPLKRTVGWFNNQLVKTQVSLLDFTQASSTSTFLFSQTNTISDSPLAPPKWSNYDDDDEDFSPLKFSDTTRTFRMSAGRPGRPKRKSTYEPANAAIATSRLNFQGYLENDKKQARDVRAKSPLYGRKKTLLHKFAVPAIPRELQDFDE